MAILGGLLRRSMCRWMEGMALKKEQPGMSNVCMIMGLRSALALIVGVRELLECFGWYTRRRNPHSQVIAQLDDPDGTTHDLYNGYCEDDADDYGPVAGEAGGIPPFGVAFPGEVVEAESRHFKVLSHFPSAIDGIIESFGDAFSRGEGEEDELFLHR